MSKLKYGSLIFAMLWTTGLSAGTRGASVALSIEPNKTLPGLSVPLNLRITAGSEPIHLAPSASVRITPPDGEPFLATWRSGRAKDDFGELALGTEDDEPLVIAQQHTIRLSLPAVDLSRPSWIRDPHLLQTPGTYRVEVLLYDTRDASGTSFVTSSPATLLIELPADADRWIWEAIVHGETSAMAESALQTQPASAYTPYLAPLVDAERVVDRIAVVERVIAAHPRTPVLPWLQLRIAELYIRASYQTFDRTQDVEQASQLADAARERLMRLQSSDDAWAARAAKVTLADVPEPGAFRREEQIIRDKRRQKQ